jgi:thiamine biosynthesis protein ThiS
VIAPLPRLHAVTDDRVVADGGVVERAAALAAAAGPRLAVQLRSRTLGGAALLDLAQRLGAALAPHGTWLIVNDRADVARAAGARAIQAGRGALALRDLRRVAPGLALGRSVHEEGEARAAAAEGADFLVAGPAYATASNPGAAPAGAALIGAAARTGLPVVAIGGLTPERAADAVAAGAWGVAAVRALWDAADPAAAARAFVAALPAASALAVVVNGESRTVAEGTTLRALLAQLGLDPRAVVVEHNRRIVRRDALDATRLAGGDAIELVHFVGGG